MKTFRVQIKHMATTLTSNLHPKTKAEAFENALIDKLGKNAITWEKDGFSDSSKLWLTYEETIDANASQGPLQSRREVSRQSGRCISVITKDILWIW